jgi:hypothetical protein
MGKIVEKVILEVIQRHITGKNLLNASQFGFHEHHSMTLQCMRLLDHVTINFNNKMTTAAVFLDIEKVFDPIWNHKLSKLDFLASVIKLISSFLTEQKLRVCC